MKLNELSDNPGARKNRTRVGRGMSSGKGKTSGAGQKGQKSRTGVSIKGFEGGQMPLYQRLPKRGFTNHSSKTFAELNLSRLQEAIDTKKLDAKKAIDAATLKEAGVITHIRDGVRLLGNGELKAKVEITVSGATKTAIAAVEKAGGKVTVIAVEKAATPKKDAKKAEREAKKVSRQ